MNARLDVLTSPMAAHGCHTGYGRVAEFLAGAHCHGETPVGRGWHRLHRLIMRAGCPARYYRPYHLRFEIGVMRRALGARPGLAHFLYGEDQYWLLSRWRPRRLRTVVTLHQPPSTQAELLRDTAHLRRADGLIVLSREQERWAARHAPEPRTRFIPHGVDTEFFCPAGTPPAGPPWQVLVVGGWQRDHDAIAACLRDCLAAAPRDWRFVLVGCGAESARYQGWPVALHGRISDEELLALYRSSHAALVVVKAAAANNALLEAMACGCPPLVSDVGGVPDYLFDAAWRVRHDPGAAGGPQIAARLRALLAADPDGAGTRIRAREHAGRFAWREIGRRTLEFHAEFVPELGRPA